MNKTVVAVCATVLTLLAGCSSDNKGSGEASKPAADPCALLTDDQVTNAIGHPPTSHATSADFQPLQGCVWRTEPEKAMLSVGFGPVTTAPIPPNLGRTWVTVDGVGDKAVYSKELGTIMVEGGGHIVRALAVLGRTDSGDERREATTLVVRYVLASLGAGPKVDDAEPKRTSNPRSSEIPDSEEPTETSEPETTTLPEPETSDPEFPDMPCSDPDKPGCPPPSER